MTRLTTTREHNFFEQMKCEQNNLVGCISRIRHALSTGQGEIPELCQTILRFSELIENHFAREENGGYLRDVTDPAPELAARATELLGEHTALRGALQTIRQLAQNCDRSDAWRQDLGREFERFAQQLMIHEAREDDLMIEGGLAHQGPAAADLPISPK